ncbi:MAG TPA: tetratricopeptide repeat protein [Xanthobacteraceae bacterium]|nr:tetratricopeptide repeat protein [Xanthobacteraceae bacterium]
MSDSQFIREIDEELRRDRLMQLWERYGHYAVGAAVLLVAATAGWRGWEWYQLREGSKYGSRFEAALVLAKGGKDAEAEQEFAALAQEGTWGYRVLSRMQLAAETGARDASAGAAAYDAIAADSSIDIAVRDVARLRAAYLLLDTAQVAEIASRVEPLNTPASWFRFSAREILALARYKAGEREAARTLFAQLAVDPETPPALRSRAEVMLTLAAGGAETPAKPGSATQ